MPTIAVEIPLTYTLLFDDVAEWLDISEYVQSFNTKAGRQHELDQIQATTLTMTLTNRTATFAPWTPYNASPITDATFPYPLVPMVPIKITATWHSVTYPIFYGYINSVNEIDPDAVNSDVTLQATDLLGWLAQVSLNSSGCANSLGGESTANGLYENAVLYDSPAAYWILGPEWTKDYSGNEHTLLADDYGLTPGMPDNVGYGYQGPILYDTSTAVSLGDGSSSPNPQGYFWCDLGGTNNALEFWTQVPAKATGMNRDQHAYIYEAMDTSAALVADFATPQLIWQTMSGSVVTASVGAPCTFNDGKWHHIVAGEFGIYCDAASVGPGITEIAASVVFGGYYNNTTASAYWQPSYPGLLGQMAVYSVRPDITGHYNAGSYFSKIETSYARIVDCLTVAGVTDPSLLPPSLPASVSCVDLQPETSPVTGTSAFSYMTSIQQTEDGLLFVSPTGRVTFYDRDYIISNPSPVVAFTDMAAASVDGVINCNYEPKPQIVRDDEDVWPIISVTRQNGNPQVAADPGGVVQFGQRVGPTGGLTGLLFATAAGDNPDQASADLAAWLLQRYKASQVRVMSVDLASTANGGANLPYMLGLGLWDVVHFVRANAPGTGLPHTAVFAQDNVIEAIGHTVTMPDKWVTNYVLSPYELLNSL
jgi:hypothetical protein